MYKVFLISSIRALIIFWCLFNNTSQVTGPSSEFSIIADLFKEGLRVPIPRHDPHQWSKIHVGVVCLHAGKHLAGSLKCCSEEPFIHLLRRPTEQCQHTFEVWAEVRVTVEKTPDSDPKRTPHPLRRSRDLMEPGFNIIVVDLREWHYSAHKSYASDSSQNQEYVKKGEDVKTLT